MDKAAIRPFVFDILRRTPQTHLHAIESEIRQRVAGYERGNALLVQEVVWELLVQGVLAPGKNSLNLQLPFVHVTEYGQDCLDEGGIVAHDPDGYVARLQDETRGDVSSIIVETARDALHAFQRGLFRVSLVLLSRAALELLREVHARLPQRDLPTAVESTLSELETVARLAHSDADGLAMPASDRDSALARLLMFPAQCRVVYAVIRERADLRSETGASSAAACPQ